MSETREQLVERLRAQAEIISLLYPFLPAPLLDSEDFEPATEAVARKLSLIEQLLSTLRSLATVEVFPRAFLDLEGRSSALALGFGEALVQVESIRLSDPMARVNVRVSASNILDDCGYGAVILVGEKNPCPITFLAPEVIGATAPAVFRMGRFIRDHSLDVQVSLPPLPGDYLLILLLASDQSVSGLLSEVTASDMSAEGFLVALQLWEATLPPGSGVLFGCAQLRIDAP